MAAGSDIFHHVRDATVFELPFGGEIPLPQIGPLQVTKFMVLQVVAAVAALLIFRGLADRVRSGEPVRGRWWNFWEAIVLFIRDEIVRPTIGTGHHDQGDHGHESENPYAHAGSGIGEHDAAGHGHGVDMKETVTHAETVAPAGHPADEHLPFVWSVFIYVLFCNLLGAIPFLGSATGDLSVTGVLAVVTFGMVVYTGSQQYGFDGFLKSLVPSMDLPGPIGLVIIPMIWVIELIGLLIKHGVLAVRLFANIMAGHTVIAAILGFIALTADQGALWFFVTPASIAGQVAIGLLELFVAFLQAYVFAFLATLFIGAAVHPH